MHILPLWSLPLVLLGIARLAAWIVFQRTVWVSSLWRLFGRQWCLVIPNRCRQWGNELETNGCQRAEATGSGKGSQLWARFHHLMNLAACWCEAWGWQLTTTRAGTHPLVTWTALAEDSVPSLGQWESQPTSAVTRSRAQVFFFCMVEGDCYQNDCY